MRVVINMQSDGSFEVATDEPCEVFVVNDHCPHDRVYKLGASHSVGRDFVDAQLRNDPIGSSSDERHEAIKHRVLSAAAGEPHLTPVSHTDWLIKLAKFRQIQREDLPEETALEFLCRQRRELENGLHDKSH